jgi:hypothetical protein
MWSVPRLHKELIVCRTFVKQKIKIWSWARDGSPTPRQTGRLIVGHNLTSTSTILFLGDVNKEPGPPG